MTQMCFIGNSLLPVANFMSEIRSANYMQKADTAFSITCKGFDPSRLPVHATHQTGGHVT
jgi:hypothetical protein